jgi:hypothetical protein
MGRMDWDGMYRKGEVLWDRGGMTSSALVDLLRLVEGAGISVWFDGGWGVDALLERQSREHRKGLPRYGAPSKSIWCGIAAAVAPQ